VSFVFFLMVLFVAHALVGMTLGRLAVRAGPARPWGALVLGVLVVAVLTAIPVVGGWLGAVIAIFGLGALILEFWPWRPRAAEPAAA
jgi:hypothetical protein